MKHKLTETILALLLVVSGAAALTTRADDDPGQIPDSAAASVIEAKAGHDFDQSQGSTVLHCKSFASYGYTGEEKDVFAPTGDEIKNFVFTSQNWTVTGSADSSKRLVKNGISGVYIERYSTIPVENPEDIPLENPEIPHESVELTMDLSGGVMADEYRTISFGVELEGVLEAAVTTEIFSGSNSSLAETVIKEGWNLVTIDAGDILGAFSHIRISVDSESGGCAVRITSPFAEVQANPDFETIARYSTNSITDEVGRVILDSGRITPSGGRAAFTAEFTTFDDYPSEENAYLEFKVSGLYSASFTLGINCKNAPDTLYSKRISVSSSADSSSGTYIIPIDPADDIESYVMQFDNVKCDASFTVEYVRFHRECVNPIEAESGVGTLTKLTKDGTAVTFSGSMERAAVAEYSSGKNGDGLIHFYAIPCGSMDDIGCAFEIGSIKLTTVFNYSADISVYPNVVDGHMFFAGVADRDGNIIPFSRPRFPDYASATSTNTEQTSSAVSSVGLYKPASVGAFESNASRVIIDVPLDKYIKKGGGVLVNYTSYPDNYTDGADLAVAGSYEIDRELLGGLDSEISFYITAGVRVYLRLSSGSFISGLTEEDPSGEFYQLSSSSDSGMFASVVRFFAERYPSLTGFELGCGVNLVPASAVEDGGITAYSGDLACTVRILYNAAREFIADPYIIIPFVSGESDSEPYEENASEEGGSSENDINEKSGYVCVPPEVLTPLVSETLQKIGTVPWIYMYTIDECENAADRTNSLADLLTELDCAGMSGIMYFFEPDSAYISKKFAENKTPGEQYSAYAARMFGELLETTKSSSTRGVFFSLEMTDLSNDHEFYAALKEIGGQGGTSRYIYDSTASVSPEKSYASAYTAYDFTKKYYPDGWIAGGGVGSCLTDYSKIEGVIGRVLRAEFSSGSDGYKTTGAAGITLCRLGSTVNLTGVDAAVFEASLTLPEGTSGETLTSPIMSTVVFVIGSGDNRAEYYAEEVAAGQYYTFTCDLSGYEKSSEVNYMGIMVYSDEQVGLELKSVELCSDSLSSDEIKSRLNPVNESENQDGIKSNLRFVTMAAFTVFVGTIVTFVILARYEREEEEKIHIEKGEEYEKRKRQRQ